MAVTTPEYTESAPAMQPAAIPQPPKKRPIIGAIAAAAVVLAAAAITIVGLATAAPAQASPSTTVTPAVVDCTPTLSNNSGGKHVQTTLKDRPDSGTAGNVWALDTGPRDVWLCEVGPVDGSPGLSTYTALVNDIGKFVTLEGKSPGGGATVPAGIQGNIRAGSGFKATFTAKSGFGDYMGNLSGATASGAPVANSPTNPTTDTWLQVVWGGGSFSMRDNLRGWKWRYTTACPGALSEEWINAWDGNAGDIAGKACPSPSPSASASTGTPSTGASARAVSASTPAVGGTGGGSETLPVTGSRGALYAGGGVVLLAAGAGLLVVGLRRRAFEA